MKKALLVPIVFFFACASTFFSATVLDKMQLRHDYGRVYYDESVGASEREVIQNIFNEYLSNLQYDVEIYLITKSQPTNIQNSLVYDVSENDIIYIVVGSQHPEEALDILSAHFALPD